MFVNCRFFIFVVTESLPKHVILFFESPNRGTRINLSEYISVNECTVIECKLVVIIDSFDEESRGLDWNSVRILMKTIIFSKQDGEKCQRISYLRRSFLPEVPPFPPTKLAGDMFIVNESYSEGGSWRTATCPWNATAGRRRLRQQIERRKEKEREASKENERDRIRVVARVLVRGRALTTPIYAPVTEPSGAIKLAL